MKEDDAISELDLIERYLAEKLNATKKAEVEIRILNDPKFALKVEDLRQIKQLLRAAMVQQRARAELQDIYLENSNRRWYKSRTYWLVMSTAAAFTGFVLFFGLTPVKLPSIADDLLTVRSEIPVTSEKGRQVSTYDQLLAGQEAIENKNYLLAITHLEKIQREKDLRSYFREATQWYLALAYLNSDQPKTAERYFNALLEVDNPEYPVDWVERWKLYVQIQCRKIF